MTAIVQFIVILTIFISFCTVPLFAQQCHIHKESDYGFALLSSAYKTMREQTLGSCYVKCLTDQECSSINYKLSDGHCEHSRVTKRAFPSRHVKQEGTIHAETREPEYGSSQYLAVSSCKQILQLNPKASSGVYWIQLDAQSSAFKVYCDMKTDGGGWALVYSYRFLDFNNFAAGTNAVNPIPSWYSDPSKYLTSLASVSNTVPLSETSYAAMNFSLWKKIGNEFLSKSNVLHWFSCKPDVGNLVTMTTGSISCKIVKNVASKCLNAVPNELKMMLCGLSLFKGDHYLFFEGSTTNCYPVHDPCGTRALVPGASAAGPYGTLYIR